MWSVSYLALKKWNLRAFMESSCNYNRYVSFYPKKILKWQRSSTVIIGFDPEHSESTAITGFQWPQRITLWFLCPSSWGGVNVKLLPPLLQRQAKVNEMDAPRVVYPTRKEGWNKGIFFKKNGEKNGEWWVWLFLLRDMLQKGWVDWRAIADAFLYSVRANGHHILNPQANKCGKTSLAEKFTAWIYMIVLSDFTTKKWIPNPSMLTLV